MKKDITRRDFLDGVSLSLAGAAMAGPQSVLGMARNASTKAPAAYYPPTMNGIRGNHEGAYDAAHALAWNGQSPTSYTDLDEEYDLVVVGTGISGLAAASFYQQQAGKDQRILLLDNHDDFGGHARRNEFHARGKMILSGGGSGNFEDPHRYSPEAKRLLDELGFDMDKLRKGMIPRGLQAGLEGPIGMYNDREHYGADSIVVGPWTGVWHGMGNYREAIQALPLPEGEKQRLLGFIEGTIKLQKPLPAGDLLSTLKSMSYETFTTEYVGLSKQTTRLFHPFLRVTVCTGTDSISIFEGIKSGLPALSVLGEQGMQALAASGAAFEDVDFVWMPDGNATLVRQMVRRLIPAVARGNTVEDVVTARFDYDQLDQADHPVRLRLNSTVVNVLNNEDASVSVAYVQQGKARRVKAKRCILACYNGIIPHICPQMPETQKQNIAYGAKTPLIATNVLLRNGRAVLDAGAEIFLCPDSYFAMVSTGFAANLGDYKTPLAPDDPMVVYMLTSPLIENDGTQSARDLYRLARYQLYSTSFADYEKKIREQLTGLFGATGFDADRDIEAITVNRWSHGYAYDYRDLYDPAWREGEAPHELGRQQLGRISIAGSDSEGRAYADAAIDAGWRAVQEQLEA